eukprot:CAMPEP_0198154448 /NCGR_PEP_ID=MMETSP1443-20131203/68592_1 /TAXON_ID=186043 /ORGANISM="Entomoneis sp., Strain CCMP2396" /LENGTH=586 /DNA_ID=CAMNT_0043821119 /DNA_START=83 /DNA_END=1843 /DNA_ORIENTATION=-
MGGPSYAEATPIVNATTFRNYGGSDGVAIHNNADEADVVVVPLMNVVVDGPDSESAIAPKWRDLPFAILFWAHLAVMIWLGVSVAPKGFEMVHVNLQELEDQVRKSDDVTEEDIHHLEDIISEAAIYMEVYPSRIAIFLVIPCCILAFVFGLIGMNAILKPCPRTMVYTCLISTVVWTVIGLLASAIASGQVFLYVLSGLSLFGVGYFVRLAWKMVPFAGINLKFALEGIGRNGGIFIVAFLFAVIGFFWVFYWFYVLIGTFMYQNNRCQESHPDENFDMSSDDYSDVCDPPVPVVLFFILSLYWTGSIVLNTMQVCVAGVMATFCLDKSDADGCCSPAIWGSLFRSMTYSFGSICFGSLLQAIAAVLRYLIDSARSKREQNSDAGACGTVLLCIVGCLAELLEDLLRAFNQWAYIFVGLYGFSYIESGKRVMELFQARGFTAIITDNLVGYVLGFASTIVALATAFTAWLIEHSFSKGKGEPLMEPFDPTVDVNDYSYIFGPLPMPGLWAAVIGFVIGLWVASVMMNVIKGAINTVIVCWADSPAVMEVQHPLLTQELSNTYRSVFDLDTMQASGTVPQSTPLIV